MIELQNKRIRIQTNKIFTFVLGNDDTSGSGGTLSLQLLIEDGLGLPTRILEKKTVGQWFIFLAR